MAAWFSGSLRNIPPQSRKPPGGQRAEEIYICGLAGDEVLIRFVCVFDMSCRQTCAVLPSLIKASSCSLFVLMNSFNTGLSSCTRNSFLVISIPRSNERISWRMLSRDTGKESDELSSIQDLYDKLILLDSLNVCVCTKCRLVHKVQLGVEIGQVRVFFLDDICNELQ